MPLSGTPIDTTHCAHSGFCPPPPRLEVVPPQAQTTAFVTCSFHVPSPCPPTPSILPTFNNPDHLNGCTSVEGSPTLATPLPLSEPSSRPAPMGRRRCRRELPASSPRPNALSAWSVQVPSAVSITRSCTSLHAVRNLARLLVRGTFPAACQIVEHPCHLDSRECMRH